MDSNSAAGFGKNLEGKVQENVGRATNDARMTAQGRRKQAEGSLQDLYGQASEGAGEAIDAVQRIPGSVENAIRDYIRARPFTAAAIVLGFGWLAGRLHRPF